MMYESKCLYPYLYHNNRHICIQYNSWHVVRYIQPTNNICSNIFTTSTPQSFNSFLCHCLGPILGGGCSKQKILDDSQAFVCKNWSERLKTHSRLTMMNHFWLTYSPFVQGTPSSSSPSASTSKALLVFMDLARNGVVSWDAVLRCEICLMCWNIEITAWDFPGIKEISAYGDPNLSSISRGSKASKRCDKCGRCHGRNLRAHQTHRILRITKKIVLK